MSARPACRRCAAPPATNAVPPSAAGVRVIVLALDERSLRSAAIQGYQLQLVDDAEWGAVEHSVPVVDHGKDTRKLSYHKDDRAMRPIYGALKIFESL